MEGGKREKWSVHVWDLNWGEEGERGGCTAAHLANDCYDLRHPSF